jgi:hypothetical protein
MEMVKVAKPGSWDDRAEEYRIYADEASDELVRLSYLQRAQYCDAMAARVQRQIPDAA